MNYLNKIRENNKGDFSKPKLHPEASDYEGCEYHFNKQKIYQRTAKITPTKIGQFVTLWKRNKENITEPINDSSDLKFVIIICIFKGKSGRFLFPRKTLIDKKIMSSVEYKSKGKRGFRVYPTWDKPTSKQAIATQAWQVEYFEENFII
jgi:hypothetical protein